jgi:tRNA(Ile)-lysidine synthase
VSGPPQAVARARRAVRATLETVAAEHPGALVLVACSGGADSLALAATTAFEAPRLGLRAGAVVVDHQVQTGSAAVAAEAAGRCRDLGLGPVVVRTVDVPTGPGSGGPEAAARHTRYAALEAAADAAGAVAVLLGHTADDQAETVLLGLARGSGARSLAGMRDAVGRWRRPLLGLRRTETEEVCAAQGLGWWVDPTNTGSTPGAPLRSRVRTSVLPVLDDVLGPGVVEALVRTADQLDEDDAALGALAADLLESSRRAAVPADGGSLAVRLDVATVEQAVPAVRRRCLRLAALAAGCPAGSLTREHVLGVDGLLTRWRGQGPLHLPGGVEARRVCGRLVLEHPHH